LRAGAFRTGAKWKKRRQQETPVRTFRLGTLSTGFLPLRFGTAKNLRPQRGESVGYL